MLLHQFPRCRRMKLHRYHIIPLRASILILNSRSYTSTLSSKYDSTICLRPSEKRSLNHFSMLCMFLPICLLNKIIADPGGRRWLDYLVSTKSCFLVGFEAPASFTSIFFGFLCSGIILSKNTWSMPLIISASLTST